MTRDELQQKQAVIQARFNELTKQKDEINQQLLQLKGSFDTLGELITNYPTEEVDSGRKPRRTKEPIS